METGSLLIDAQTAFARERRERRRERVLAWLLRRPLECRRLMTLDQVLHGGPPASRRRGGVVAIPLESIVGTAECTKTRAFDRRFRPLSSSRRRWERLWMAGRSGASLPPISVFRVGNQHFVGDGHHRVSVAKALGMIAIDAEVTELGPLSAPAPT